MQSNSYPRLTVLDEIDLKIRIHPLEADFLENSASGGKNMFYTDMGGAICAGGAIRVCSRGEVRHWRPSAVDSIPLAPCWPDTALVSHLFLLYGVLMVMVLLGIYFFASDTICMYMKIRCVNFKTNH